MADTQTHDQSLEEKEDFEKWEEELEEDILEAPIAGDGESLEDLEFEKRSSEKAKIELPEAFVFVMLALVADGIEFLMGFAHLLPVLGQAMWFMGWIFGLSISATIILWLILKGAYEGPATKKKRKVIVNAIIFLADAVILGGWLPLRSISLMVTIWLSNRSEGKRLERALFAIEKITSKLGG